MSDNVAIFNFLPRYCPNCGKRRTWHDHYVRDWNARCSFVCDCGLRYQLVDTPKILNAARADGGDLEER